MKIYQISGLGANQEVFRNLRIHPDFEIVYLPWLLPEKNESLSHYAERMMDKINVNEDYILMGLSFGGIILNEMNQLKEADYNILISTIKDRSEMPEYMKLSSATGIHKIVPATFFTSDNGLSYAMFRKIYSARLPDLKEIYEFRNPYYLKWSMDRIVNWNPDYELKNYVHIHGTKDVIFPSSKIKDAEIIENGTHVMVMYKPKSITEIINGKLKLL